MSISERVCLCGGVRITGGEALDMKMLIVLLIESM